MFWSKTKLKFYSQITDRVYAGGQINTTDDWYELRDKGINYIINTQMTRDDRDHMPQDLIGQMYILWLPVWDDGLPKSIEWFNKAIDFGVRSLSVSGNKLFCHCREGRNRGPSLAYAVLRAQGYPRETIMALFKQNRPIAPIAYADDAELALKALGWVDGWV